MDTSTFIRDSLIHYTKIDVVDVQGSARELVSALLDVESIRPPCTIPNDDYVIEIIKLSKRDALWGNFQTSKQLEVISCNASRLYH